MYVIFNFFFSELVSKFIFFIHNIVLKNNVRFFYTLHLKKRVKIIVTRILKHREYEIENYSCVWFEDNKFVLKKVLRKRKRERHKRALKNGLQTKGNEE